MLQLPLNQQIWKIKLPRNIKIHYNHCPGRASEITAKLLPILLEGFSPSTLNLAQTVNTVVVRRAICC